MKVNSVISLAKFIKVIFIFLGIVILSNCSKPDLSIEISGTYNTDTNELALYWNYNNSNITFKIYKHLKNTDEKIFMGQTTENKFKVTQLYGREFSNIKSFTVEVLSDYNIIKTFELRIENVKLVSLYVPKTSSTMYTLFIRSFYDSNGDGIGDFKGVTDKVDYLKNLGIDTVWFLPFNKAKSYHCYDIEDYYDVEPDYGTITDIENMIKTLNEYGIRVVMDLVVNHTSDTHPWFLDAIENTTNSPYWDYYIISLSQPTNTNHWHWKINSKGQKIWYFGLFDSSMPDLNFENPKVIEEIKKIIDFWIIVGVDGFRLDAAKHYFGWDWNDGINKSANIAKQLESYIRNKLEADCIVVSEVYDGNPEILSQFAPMPVFNFTFMYEITSNYEGKDNLLSSSINWVNSISLQYQLSTYHFPFIDNHDLNRFVSVLIDQKYSGNTVEAIKQYLLLNALLLSMNGMPVLYYGNEIGLRGWKWHSFPWDVPVREPMQWYANQQGIGQTTWTKHIYQVNGITFGNANIDGAMYDDPNDGISVEEQLNGYTILNFFKQLINLRKSYPTFGKGKILIEKDWKNLYVINRKLATQELLILINLDPTYSSTYTIPSGYSLIWYAFFNSSYFEFGNKVDPPLTQNTHWIINPRQVYIFKKN